MSTALLFFVVGAAAGIAGGWYLAYGRNTARERERIEDLEKTLSASRAEMERYRNEVVHHFETTATLFSEVSSSYRHLHRHLAEGYESLTGAPAGKLLTDDNDGGTGDGSRPALTAAASTLISDMPLPETADLDHDDLDEAARHELDAPGDDEEEDLPESLPGASPERDEQAADGAPDEEEGAASNDHRMEPGPTVEEDMAGSDGDGTTGEKRDSGSRDS